MTLTPAQLDAIAKWMGWKPDDVFPGRWNAPDGSQWERLDPSSPADAMLVLKAMGEWCDKQKETHRVWLWNFFEAWFFRLTHTPHDEPLIKCGPHDTPEAAIFQCAAKLMERIDEHVD